jgi:hypothetical protein
MKLSILLTVTTVAALGFTIAFLFLPGQYLSIFGLQANPATLWLSRYLGGAAFGYTLLAWFARNSTDSEARRAIVLAMFGAWGVAFIGLLLGQIAGMANSLGWIMVALMGLFTLAYGYFQFVKPHDSGA